MEPVRILIADDQQLFIEGIKTILEINQEFLVAETAQNGLEAIEKVKRCRPGVVLMDINMPGMDGLDSCIRIKKEFPEVKVLILSSYSNLEFVANAMHSGADGYLLKNSSIQTLTTAIRHIWEGDKFVSPELRNLNLSVQMNISRRELEILKLIGSGMSAKEIAEKLHLSVHTIETHRKNIQSKLGLKNQSMLVKYAVERGLN